MLLRVITRRVIALGEGDRDRRGRAFPAIRAGRVKGRRMPQDPSRDADKPPEPGWSRLVRFVRGVAETVITVVIVNDLVQQVINRVAS